MNTKIKFLESKSEQFYENLSNENEKTLSDWKNLAEENFEIKEDF